MNRLINLLLAGMLFPITTSTLAQTYEVFDQNLKLKSRIEYDQISILGDAVRISSTNNEIKLLSKEYKPFYNLKAESLHTYAEPWLIVNGPKGKGAYHEYGEAIFEMDYEEIQTSYTKVLARKESRYWLYDRLTRDTKLLGEFDKAFFAPNGQIIAKIEDSYLLPLSPTPEKRFQDIRSAGNDFLLVLEPSGFGLVNRDGEMILDTIIEQLQHIEDEYFYAFDGNQYMLIRAKEEKADIRYVSYHRISLEGDMILEYIHGKLRRVMKNDGILLDQTGMERVVSVNEKHYNIFMRDKKIGLLGPKGWEVNPVADVEKILPGKEQLFGALKSGKYGFIDKAGSWVIKNNFDEVRKFNEGQAAVRIGSSWGFVSSQGVLIDPQYEGVSDFKNGLSIVTKNGKQQIIDKQNQPLLAAAYGRITFGPDGFFYTEENGKYGLVSPEGKEILLPIYDELRREDSNRILVRLDSKYGLIDEQGNYLLPLYYKNILFDSGSKQILAEDNYQFRRLEAGEKSTSKKKKPATP